MDTIGERLARRLVGADERGARAGARRSRAPPVRRTGAARGAPRRARPARGQPAVGRQCRGRWRARALDDGPRPALVAFFVVPAVIFAAWSYRRLRSDDAEERALLVWQTLRGVASGGLDDLPADATLVGTPILLYDDGVLRSSSDSLYDDIAPLGRFLRPDLELGLDLGNEVRASRSEALGGGRV